MDLINEEYNSGYRISKTQLFTVGYCVWLFSQLIIRTEFSSYFPHAILLACRFSGLGLAVASEILFLKKDGLSYRLIVAYLLAAFIVVNNYLLAGGYYYFDISCLILTSRGVDYKKFLKSILIYLSYFYVAVIVSAEIGLIDNVVTYRELGARHNLGFGWSTWPVHAYFYILSGYLMLRNTKVKIGELVAFEILNIWFYYQTGTRSPFFLMSVLLLLVGLINYFKINLTKLKVFKVVFFSAIPVLTGIIYYLSINAPRYPTLNTMLSGRLNLGYAALNNYGISLLGRHVTLSSQRDIIGQSYGYLDSSFLQYLVKYGLISFFIFVGVMVLLQSQMMTSGNSAGCLAFLFLIMNGFLDPQFIEPFYNFYMVFIGGLLILRKRQVIERSIQVGQIETLNNYSSL